MITKNKIVREHRPDLILTDSRTGKTWCTQGHRCWIAAKTPTAPWRSWVVGGMDLQLDKVAERIDDVMAIAALDLLARVISSWP